MSANPISAVEGRDANDIVRRLFTKRYGSLFFITFCIGITLISLGITGTLALLIGQDQSVKLGNLGQIFESVNAAFSGLAFVALVVTFRMQYDELRLQRHELRNQHRAMNESQEQLRRSAECDVRGRHVELIRMAMEDDDLAEFWPKFVGNISTKLAKQYNYANLVVQHQRLLYDLGIYDQEDAKYHLRYLFTSPIMRSYWEASLVARALVMREDNSEWSFDKLVDAAYHETPPEPPSSTRREHARTQDIDVLDFESHRAGEADSEAA